MAFCKVMIQKAYVVYQGMKKSKIKLQMTPQLVYLLDLRIISQDVWQVKMFPGKSKLQGSDDYRSKLLSEFECNKTLK